MDLMIDLETLGTKMGSPIVTIGAVLFDPLKQDTVEHLMNRAFLARVHLTDAVKYSIGMDPGTIHWWFTQPDEAIKALVTGEAWALYAALEDLYFYATVRGNTWTEKYFPGHSQEERPTRVWAKSPDFDCKMLEYAYEATKGEGRLAWPFKYSEYRCVRTLQDLAWPDGPGARPQFDVGAKHDARVDAVEQALTVQAGFLALGLSVEGVRFSNYKVNP